MLKVKVPCTFVHAVLDSATEVARFAKAPDVAQSVVFVDIVTVGLLLSGVASRTYALTWYVAPATTFGTLNRFRLGPIKLAVRFVVRSACLSPFGSNTGGATLVRVTDPNGAHPSRPPSVKV